MDRAEPRPLATVLESPQVSPLATRTEMNISGTLSQLRRQSIPATMVTGGSKSPLAFPSERLTTLQRNHRQRQLNNSFLGGRLSKVSAALAAPQRKGPKREQASPLAGQGGEDTQAHLLHIDETASNMGNTSLYFTNETFMFKREEHDGVDEERAKARSILDVRTGQRDPAIASSPLGQNPSLPAYSTPKAEIKALKGVRRFNRESALTRKALDPQFASTMRDQGEASELSRKVFLPDIIRLSRTNLHDIAQLSGQRKADFLRRFKNSIQLVTSEEARFDRRAGNGRLPPPKHPPKADASTCPYQNAHAIRQIEPTNVKKKRYHKAFGDSWQPDPKLEVHYLKKCQEDFNQV